MTTWFVSRHPGALHWMQTHGPAFDRHVAHLDLDLGLCLGPCLGLRLGILGRRWSDASCRMNLAAEVCARGARYFNLSLQLSASDRGQELSADDLQRRQAQLQEFHIQLTPRTYP